MRAVQYRSLGHSELSVSVIGLGTWLTLGSSVGPDGTREIVRRAYDLGINLFDTADVYSEGDCERALGAALRGMPREDLCIATKAFFPLAGRSGEGGLSRKHLLTSVEDSLGRMDIDYIDLHQCHRYDPDTPLEETVGTYGELMQQHKVRHWGVSLWTPEQIERVCRVADRLEVERPISIQSQYSILQREIEAELLPACEHVRLSQLVFSPLAQGVLSGKYSGGVRPENTRAADPRRRVFIDRYIDTDLLDRVDALGPLAAELGMTIPQLALAWCLRQPSVASAIVGVTKISQLEDNCAAAGAVLPPETLKRIDDLFCAT
jgi:aryl-alcohol dehydrogenase-like predicted oxidoreductase